MTKYYKLFKSGQDLNVYVSQFVGSSYTHSDLIYGSFIGTKRDLVRLDDSMKDHCYYYVDIYTINSDNHTRQLLINTSIRRNNFKTVLKRIDKTDMYQMMYIDTEYFSSFQKAKKNIKDSDYYFSFKAKDLFPDVYNVDDFSRMSFSNRQEAIISSPTFISSLYQKLKKQSEIPVLEEWIPRIVAYLAKDHPINTPGQLICQDYQSDSSIYMFEWNIRKDYLEEAITYCFKHNYISLRSSEELTSKLDKISSLTEYIEEFGDSLAQKAQGSYDPLFSPGVDIPDEKANQFFSCADYFGNLKFYESQKDVICAISKNLDRGSNTLVMGECGSGKTDIALGSIFVSSKKKAPVTIIMCPGHIVEKWKREILRIYPLAKAVIANSLKDIQEAEKLIRSGSLRNPFFIVMSKDVVKIDYDKRPMAVWDDNKHKFYCPEKPNYDFNDIKDFNVITMFNKMNSNNKKCEKRCRHCARCLWTTANPNEKTDWVKVPGNGWINKKAANYYVNKINDLTKDNNVQLSKEQMKAYSLAQAALAINKSSGLRRYSMSSYIERKMKGLIDFFVADEVHQYSSSTSDQGRAFANLVNASKKTIALTGTLVNGYVENLFYMLYRLYPQMIASAGFKYTDAKRFVEEYGFYDEITERTYDVPNETYYHVHAKTSKKYKPGISPLVFSRFLLDKAICVSLSDMTKDLPNYKETTVPVDLEPDVQTFYDDLMTAFKTTYSGNHGRRNRDGNNTFGKTIFKAVRCLSSYPDQPYNQFPIFDNDSNIQVLIPQNAPIGNIADYASPKDLATLEIAQRHIANHEKILIYLDQVNKMDCKDRLIRLFKKNNIKAMFLSSEVSAQSREEWIMKQIEKNGVDVLICNPALVETGLDLLDFTTIIFYQTGYNLFTMRQASRRSLRLNQSRNVNVYFLYYRNTVQENIIALMANKLQAAMAIEGKFSEEGLNALSENDTILTQIATNLSKNIETKLNEGVFDFNTIKPEDNNDEHFKENNTVVENWFYDLNLASNNIKRDTFSISKELLALKAG